MTLLLLVSETVFCCKSPLAQSRIRDTKLAVCQSDSQGQKRTAKDKTFALYAPVCPVQKKGDVALEPFSPKLL